MALHPTSVFGIVLVALVLLAANREALEVLTRKIRWRARWGGSGGGRQTDAGKKLC